MVGETGRQTFNNYIYGGVGGDGGEGRRGTGGNGGLGEGPRVNTGGVFTLDGGSVTVHHHHHYHGQLQPDQRVDDTGTSSASVIPTSTSPALPVTDTQLQSSHSRTRAKLGRNEGKTASLVQALAAVATYLRPKASAPRASQAHEFGFRRHKSQNVQITIVLEAPNLTVTDTIPGVPPTYERLTPSCDAVQVAWKVITLSVGGDPVSIHSPKDLGFGDADDRKGILEQSWFCFAPLQTLVTKTRYWKHAVFRDRSLAPVVLAKNASGCPTDFALGTYYVKPSPGFSPFLVIRGVHDGQLCVAPRCEDLRINAYITENIQERQILYDEFHDFGPLPLSLPDAPAEEEEESDFAPQPTGEQHPDERCKILTPALLGGSGKLVSDLSQRTQWSLVKKHGKLRLIVKDEA